MEVKANVKTYSRAALSATQLVLTVLGLVGLGGHQVPARSVVTDAAWGVPVLLLLKSILPPEEGNL